VRDFQAGPPARLRLLPAGAKILYTAFAIATVIGLLVSARLYRAAVGDAGPAAYYGGAPMRPQATVTAPPPAGGIELAPEDAAPERSELIAERRLLEVTHFHVFTIPLFVLVIAHLWMLAKVPLWAQNAGVVLAVATSGLHSAHVLGSSRLSTVHQRLGIGPQGPLD